MSTKLKRAILAVAAVAVLGAGGAAIAGAAGGGGDDGRGSGDDGSGKPITGAALDRASRVALDYTGGGQVSDTEFQDEEGYYEVEVTRDDGSNVDVHLDSHFNVLNKSSDGEGTDED